jgi:hypothetical protein
VNVLAADIELFIYQRFQVIQIAFLPGKYQDPFVFHLDFRQKVHDELGLARPSTSQLQFIEIVFNLRYETQF